MIEKEIILTCEHATNFIDPELNNLGLSKEQLNTHIAYDKGCKEITQKLAKKLSCQYVLGTCSRLVCDLNRRLNEASLILEESDGIKISGNVGLSDRQKNQRLEKHYFPYHQKIAQAIASCKKDPFILSIHSFTPQLMTDSHKRPWHAGLLYFNECNIIKGMLRKLEATGMCIGKNQPYDIRSYNTGTIAIHGQDKGIKNCIIEIRDDEFIDFDAGVDKWVGLIEEILLNVK